MQTIIYVMRGVDSGKHTNNICKKVGITGGGNATLSSRLQQIGRKKSPFQVQYCTAAWKHENAHAVEKAIHRLLEDSRIEGEWFLDEEDTLEERMELIMKLIGAEVLEIEQSNDAYTQSFLKKEVETKKQSASILGGEISGLLDKPLISDTLVNGPTFDSDKKLLRYKVFARKSGRHHLLLGRSKDVYEGIKELLESHNFAVEQQERGHALVMAISAETIANVINLIEREFEPK